MLYIIEFKNYSSHISRVFQGLKGRDIDRVIRTAVKKAKADGYKGPLSQIPDRYFEGLTPVEFSVTGVTEEPVGLAVTPAMCEHCQHFEDGHCARYGAVENRPYYECDRYLNISARALTYDDEEVGVYFIVNSKEEPTVKAVVRELTEAGIDVMGHVYKHVSPSEYDPALLGFTEE